MPNRLVVGCGYVGLPVAKRWVEQGDRVFAITRRADFGRELESLGIHPLIWDWYSPWPLESDLIDIVGGQLSTILISVSHAQVPNRPPERTHVDGLDQLLAALAPAADSSKWVYLSTTGVFGSGSSGDWLDETSLVSPLRPGSIAADQGERWIREHINEENRLILRPSGIYGPLRVPNWRAIRDGNPLAMHPDSFVNLIHVADLVDVILELSSKRPQFDLYCVSDGMPPTRQEYYSYVAKLGKYREPIFAPESSSAMSRSDSNKRISSKRLLQELQRPLSFPTYREGLESLLAELT
jgi:nucleoside-diphosphate-sugar epimerase